MDTVGEFILRQDESLLQASPAGQNKRLVANETIVPRCPAV